MPETTPQPPGPGSLDSPLSPDRAAIISSCPVGNSIRDFDASRVFLFDDYVVKLGGTDLPYEADTQAFVYTAALNNSQNAPRVPEVYEHFSRNGVHYLVMERIKLPTVEDWIKDANNEAEAQSRFEKACETVANALRWLFGLSPPVGSEIGSIDGAYAQTQSAAVRAVSGCARHRFFGASDAHFRYTGAPALERHINEALSHRPRSAPSLAVNISNEPLVMVQGAIRPRNFLIDPRTLQVTLINYSCVSALPRSFVSFTLHSASDEFIARISDILGWKRSDNYLAMVAATRIYSLMSDLALDKDGFRVPKVTSRRRRSKHSVKS